MNFGGLIKCGIFNGVNMLWESERTQDDLACWEDTVLVVETMFALWFFCFAREAEFLQSRGISVSNNF